MPWKKILCPIDFSDTASKTLRETVALAIESKATLVLAHVWTPPVYMLVEPLGVPPGMLADLVGTSQTRLREAKQEAERLGAPHVVTVLLQGVPWEELVSLAKRDDDIDLIAIGTHGRTGIKHALMGSVAEKVVQHASCPVLVLRCNATLAA